MPAMQRYRLRPHGIKTHEVTVFCKGTRLAEFYLMADPSTTTGQIPILFAGGYWARRQLHNSVNYVFVASKCMISLTSLEGV